MSEDSDNNQPGVGREEEGRSLRGIKWGMGGRREGLAAKEALPRSGAWEREISLV